MAFGQTRSASRKLIAVRTPQNFASQLAEATQPRPTSTGFPRSLGFSTCSTDAKTASTSACTMLEVLGFEFLHNPSHAQPDHGFRSAAVSLGGASEESSDESAGLKPRATVSCPASCDPRCGSEEAPQSFSNADAGLAASLACRASRAGVGNTLSTQLTASRSHVITSMAAPG